MYFFHYCEGGNHDWHLKSEAISKLITPHPSKRFEPGDHYYLFVDFATIEEAAAAQTALDGQDGPWGGKLRLGRARGESTKMISDRQKLASQNEDPETADVSAA